MRVSFGDTSIVYATPNKMTAWRVRTLFSKEPDTIAWLLSFRSGDVLIDIGANVGMYTIFAAGVFADRVAGRAILLSVIDNLVKGASGQAVQNMNLMCGLGETTALDQQPLFP